MNNRTITKRFHFVNFWLYVILVSLAISPAFSLGADNRNILLIGVMGLSPFVVFSRLTFTKNDALLITFMGCLFLFPMINHPETMRWSTVMYTAMFCLTFMAYTRLLQHSSGGVESYSTLLKWLIYAYTIVLLIQQFCVLTGLPIFNQGNINPLEPWKLNSLTSEPAHSARFMGIMMYSYIVTREIILGRSYHLAHDRRKDAGVWFSFFWTMTTMISGTAFLLIFLVLSKFMKKKNLIYLAVGLSVIVLIAETTNITSYMRAKDLAIASLTLDEKQIIQADPSGAYRIVPVIIAAKELDLTLVDGWLGKGVDYMSTILHKRIPGTPEGYSNGGMMLLFAEYGLITFLLFLYFTLRVCITRNDISTYIFWLFLIFLVGINRQPLWCTVVMLYTNRYYLKRQSLSH